MLTRLHLPNAVIVRLHECYTNNHTETDGSVGVRVGVDPGQWDAVIYVAQPSPQEAHCHTDIIT